MSSAVPLSSNLDTLARTLKRRRTRIAMGVSCARYVVHCFFFAVSLMLFCFTQSTLCTRAEAVARTQDRHGRRLAVLLCTHQPMRSELQAALSSLGDRCLISITSTIRLTAHDGLLDLRTFTLDCTMVWSCRLSTLTLGSTHPFTWVIVRLYVCCCFLLCVLVGVMM